MAYQQREKRVSEDIRQLNLEFLRLLGQPAACPSPPRCGLDGVILTRLARLSREELETLAAAPCLLATVPLARCAPERSLAAEPAAGLAVSVIDSPATY